jgi:hypothetical protein
MKEDIDAGFNPFLTFIHPAHDEQEEERNSFSEVKPKAKRKGRRI